MNWKSLAQRCKIISGDNDKITINDTIVKKVNEFTFLGSMVSGSSSDIRKRIAIVSLAFDKFKEKIWK